MRLFFGYIRKFLNLMPLGAIRLYQLVFPAFKYFFIGSEPACRFSPSCSRYAQDAYKTHGVIKGTFLTFFRILRCNPCHSGGRDPVPKIFLFNKAWKSSKPEHY